ncbi:phage regulatory CII family protein, partial [Escherichia coli]
MFDYQVSKHPHFDEACRAFALRHNLVQLAERAGMNVQILRNKLNPAQPHLLTAPEIWLLTDLMRIPLYSITDWHRSPISDSHPFDQPG